MQERTTEQNELLYDITMKCLELVSMIDKVEDIPVPKKIRSRANALVGVIEPFSDGMFGKGKPFNMIFDRDCELPRKIMELPVTARLSVSYMIDSLEEQLKEKSKKVQ